MIKIKIKIIFILTAVFLFGFGLYLAQAAENSLEGYAWSENIGWISFNCSNNNSCAVVDYSVKINEANGKFSGYAWSENLGWIDFSPNPSYPAQPNKSAELDFSTGQTSGWARIVSLKDYSDSGWIKMSGSNYGVVLNSGIFDGFAWSDEIGWIDFSPQYVVSAFPWPNKTEYRNTIVQINFNEAMDPVAATGVYSIELGDYFSNIEISDYLQNHIFFKQKTAHEMIW